ncbi:uncharacterized protein RJT20DRAFT_128280 [Scheffersomyces xylosifermentans]|uniref:uncharacterized protein n=1 Tax=Scheffersomyces xylosifermentans TaxID=1304137 RepID=UPI00315CACB5
MTIQTTTFAGLESLPFADGKFEATPKITEPIKFALEKDPSRKVTLFPVHDHTQVPKALIEVLQDEFNYVVEEGKTYPHYQQMNYDEFVHYWFHAFVAILIEGEYESLNDEALKSRTKSQWKDIFLGNFYVKPNYIGRCSHVCNGGFVVSHEKRGLGLGKELGRKYLVWGPQLGYVYSVFNLVFETNVASLKIWDSLGFERIGYVKNVAVLKGSDKLVGAHMFGKEFNKVV